MKITKTTNHGNPRWRVDFGRIGGKRRVKFFTTKTAAEHAMNMALKARAEVGEHWMELSPKQRANVLMVVGEIEQAGLTIEKVWETFKAEKLRPVETNVTLEAAIKEMLAAKRLANRRPRYIKSLQSYLGLFARGRENLTVDHIKARDIEAWFAGRNEALATQNSNLGRLSALFSFCVRRGYITSNPCDDVDRPYVEHRPPAILTPWQVAKALAYTRRKEPRFLAWLVLAMLCGLRPEEAGKAKWQNINLEAGTVTVDAAASKVRFRRIVHPKTMALAWLDEARKLKAVLPVDHSSRRRFVRRLRSRLGFNKWPQDCLRHTAASYWIADVKDAGKVANELGTSAGILLKHYRELVTSDEADRVWGMVPNKHSCHCKVVKLAVNS